MFCHRLSDGKTKRRIQNVYIFIASRQNARQSCFNRALSLQTQFPPENFGQIRSARNPLGSTERHDIEHRLPNDRRIPENLGQGRTDVKDDPLIIKHRMHRKKLI